MKKKILEKGDVVYCDNSNELAIYHGASSLWRNSVMAYVKKHERVQFAPEYLTLISKGDFK